MKMDDHSYNNDNLLLNFPPFLQKHLEELFFNRPNPLTLERFTIKDISPLLSKQYRDDVNTYYCYHYTFKLPYAGRRLNWEVIFNPDNLSFAPDFSFSDEFLYDPDVETLIDNVPSLVSWNVNNPKCLGSVLEELLRYYKKWQIEKLKTENIYSQIHNEYELLVKNGIIDTDSVEVIVESSTLLLLIDIKVDTSSLPTYIQPLKDDNFENWLNPGRDQAILKIHFLKLDGSRVNVTLNLSPLLEQVLGNSGSLHIPPYTKNTTLSSYVNDIIKLMEDHVKRIEENYKRRKEFVSYVCSKRIESLVECDTEYFKFVSFICSIEDSYFLVYISIGDNFPEEKPSVTFQSAYCGSIVAVDDYPYSSRWSPEEIIKRLLSYLADAIPKSFSNKHLNIEN